MKIADALADAAEQFQSVDPNTAGMDARILMQHVMGYDLTQLMLYKQQDLTPDQTAQWTDYMAQRLTHKPVAKITGEKEFYGTVFKTTDATLDPRPDSETLIDHVRTLYTDKDAPLRILDLGTGTGCLMITLLRLYPNATGVAVDVSPDALDVARYNTAKHHLADRLDCLQSHWFKDVTGSFDLIISNPPYIDEQALGALDKSVIGFDPMLALSGGPDGLDAYRIITTQASSFLKPHGYLVVEIGFDQNISVPDLFTQAGFQNTTVIPDLGGNPRVVSGVNDATSDL